jgi:hypothetical protein
MSLGKSNNPNNYPIQGLIIPSAPLPIPLNIPAAVNITKPPVDVKIATPDLILPLKESSVPIDAMETLIFQDIGGEEILNMSRMDLVGEEQIENQNIQDLQKLYQDYNPTTILTVPDASDPYFNAFQINLDNFNVDEYQINNYGYVVSGENVFNIVNAYSYEEVLTTPESPDYELLNNKIMYTTSSPHGFSGPTSESISGRTYVKIYGVNPDVFNTSYNDIANNINYIYSVPTPTTFVVQKQVYKIYEYQEPNIVYIDPKTGDLVIEIVNISDQATVEVEIWDSENISNSNKNKYDTLYLL